MIAGIIGVATNDGDSIAILVYGMLKAEATSNNRITLTRSGTSGTWGGIRF